MNKECHTQEEIWLGLYPRISFLLKENKWKWKSLGAIFGLGGGVLAALIGAVCDIAARCMIQDDSIILLKRISIISFFVCLPLMFLGAHFLDLLEKK